MIGGLKSDGLDISCTVGYMEFRLRGANIRQYITCSCGGGMTGKKIGIDEAFLNCKTTYIRLLLD